MARASLRVALVAVTLAVSSALRLERGAVGNTNATVLKAMLGYGPDPASALEWKRRGVEVHELADGRISVLPDPWWVGNRHLKLVTVETRPNKTEIEPLDNVGLGQPWNGTITKLRAMDAWLSSQARDGSMVIFVDGEDMFFGGCSQEQFLQDYREIVTRSNGSELVVGAERGCFPYEVNCGSMPAVPAWAVRNWSRAGGGSRFGAAGARGAGGVVDREGQMRFLNSGFVMGPVEQVAEFFHGALNKMELRPIFGTTATDQYFATVQFLEHLNSTVLDYGSVLVTTLYSLNVTKLFQLMPNRGLYNRITGKQQCFLHANGPAIEAPDLQKLASWLKGGPLPW